MSKPLEVEVVFALPEEQQLLVVSLSQGATVADAIAAAGVAGKFPEIDMDSLEVGIWGRVTDRDALVKAGDRVEIYRPLLRDPREARRDLAQAGLTMRGGEQDDR